MKTLQQCREACGGHGYHIDTNLGNIYKHIDIYTTFEGDNTVLLQQLFQTYLKEIKKKMNNKKWIIYKTNKFFNRNIGYLFDCFNENGLDCKVFLFNISHIIEYKVIHILLLLKGALDNNEEPFNVWKSHLNDIILISKVIALKHILEVVIEMDMHKYTLELFILQHIRNNIELYSEFITLETIKNLGKYEEFYFQNIMGDLPYYIDQLDIGDIPSLQKKNYLYQLMSRL